MDQDLIAVMLFYFTMVAGLSYAIILAATGKAEKINQVTSTFLVFFFIIFWITFLTALSGYPKPYNIAIVPIDYGYTPFSKYHSLSLFTFLALSFVGIYKVWKKGKKLPPLLLVIYLSFITVGGVICTFIILHIAFNSDSIIHLDEVGGFAMLFAPILQIVISLLLLVKIIREEANVAEDRKFRNKALNFLNQKLKRSKTFSIWIVIVLLPVYLIITLILLLLGQDVDSMVKVFTETTTWYFSEKTHPPYLDYNGHYLCTVAVCGDPKIVKPLRLGMRHGNEIVVNRQLLIANAFEDLIQQKSPSFHRFIRRNYDKYGYPLSKKITTPARSNITYILMKPLEWIFLTTIYLCSERPEKLINEQYKMKVHQ